MYNHYLDDGSFVLLDPEPQNGSAPVHPGQRSGDGLRRPGSSGPAAWNRPAQPVRPKNDLLKEVTGGLAQLLEGLLKHFSLEHFDTGDILLVLIILFLYLEDGDNLELVITLGLLLLLGLDGEEARGRREQAQPDNNQSQG